MLFCAHLKYSVGCSYQNVQMCVYVCVHVCVYACVVCMYRQINVGVLVCVCICIYVCVYLSILCSQWCMTLWENLKIYDIIDLKMCPELWSWIKLGIHVCFVKSHFIMIHAIWTRVYLGRVYLGRCLQVQPPPN